MKKKIRIISLNNIEAVISNCPNGIAGINQAIKQAKKDGEFVEMGEGTEGNGGLINPDHIVSVKVEDAE